MKKLLICLPLLVVATQAHAQLQKERAEASDNVLIKAAQLDILNQILPLVFTKEQWRKLLPSVEKARELVKTTERQEADELIKLEKRMNEAYIGATERGELPKPELLREFHAKIAALTKVRQVMAETNVANVFEVFEKTANAGQRKTAMNSLNPKQFGKVEDMKDEDKVRLFVSEILLHPLSYDLMRKLSIGD